MRRRSRWTNNEIKKLKDESEANIGQPVGAEVTNPRNLNAFSLYTHQI